MNNILDNLFYTEKLGIGNKTTFIKNVRERHPEIKTKEIQEYLKNQEVNQINTTCLLYTSDAADDSLRVDLGGRRII